MATAATETHNSLFESATPKQFAVLLLLDDGRTSKEIAYELGVSESAINQRIESLRAKMGGISRAALTRAFRTWRVENFTCNDLTGKIFQLSASDFETDTRNRNGEFESLALSDSMTLDSGIPWASQETPRVVPEVLDGKNAALYRWMCVVGIALATTIMLLVLLSVAQSLGDLF